MNSIKPLSEAEMDIMLIVWRNPQPISAPTILEQLRDIRPWSLQTLYTALSRLEGKTYLCCDKKGRNKTYTALIAEEDYRRLESRSFLKRVYNNSVKNMMVSLYQGNALDEKDLAELREFLDRIEEERPC